MCGARRAVQGQALPEGPIRAFDGKVAVSGEVIATGGNADEIAFFNYTDYEHNALRMIRFGVSGVYRPANWLALVGEVRSEDLDQPNAYAAYVRRAPVAQSRVRHPGRKDSADVRRRSAAARTEPTIRSSAIRSPIST